MWWGQKVVRKPKIAAIVRSKNELTLLKITLPSIIHYFDEVIFVDHNSVDGTADFLKEINSPKVFKFKYTEDIARYGMNYSYQIYNGGGSIAEYYNFAFSQSRADYLCKWDADMLPLPHLYSVMTDIRDTKHNIAAITGLDSLGLTTCNLEPRIYRRDLGLKYIDGETCEILDIRSIQAGIKVYESPTYIHIKNSFNTR